MLTINNTLEGYLKDVEILGNTIQGANNLADIRSVGDTVEGQELYEIPVLSRGKNLFNPFSDDYVYALTNGIAKVEHTTNEDGSITILSKGAYDWGFTEYKNVTVPKNITMSIIPNGVVTKGNVSVWLFESNGTKICEGANTKITFTSTTGKINVRLYVQTTTSYSDAKITYKPCLIEEGTQATPYEPYQEDKLTILSPVQLEKVGDVADRIIEKDGVWGVEKNIIQVDSSNINWSSRENSSKLLTFEGDLISSGFIGNNEPICILSSKLNAISYDEVFNNVSVEGIGAKVYNNRVIVRVNINPSRLNSSDVVGIKKYFENSFAIIPTYVPTFIPLPHDQQVKLRTFAGKTNISFLTEIEGTIKAQVPKSLGATVNTHTEQINNLNKELDRVKKLEESTVSTVETESDFTTVEATSNGYFEDVKLEGKTLVNLAKTTTITLSNTNSANRIQNVPCIRKLEKGKVYTLFAKCTDYSLNGVNGVKFGNWGLSGGTINDATICKGVGGVVYKFTIKENATTTLVQVFVDDDNTEGSATLTDFVILEGDHTQNPPSGYIEGLKSVGQSASEDGADEIVVSSVNENLFDGVLTYGYTFNDAGALVSNSDRFYTDLIEVKYGVTYSVPTGCVAFAKYTENKKPLGNSIGSTLTIPYNCKYIRIIGSVGSNHDKNIMLTVNSQATEYTPHQSDKKRLLYYNNETQAWEKPILRQWDSIEKHADGKYYYHQRSGEVVLNGSENWGINPKEGNIMQGLLATPNINTLVISDKFKYSQHNDVDECIWVYNKNNIVLNIAKSKLSTQDVQGFKQWLQANNVTVVYQLAEEKVYECTNIDLITYANETNYIVESGAIVPKTTLKVHNNISNVVKILQEKVSLLENKFIEGLKKVLAGDMYSLAELLYPEDFVEENPENNIMLLPLE